jgi:hypothetical protein
MRKKKWSLSDVEATIAIVLLTTAASTAFVLQQSKLNRLGCELIQIQILGKEVAKQDYTSGIKANTVTKAGDRDVIDYWRHLQEQVIRLGIEIKTLEERREREC